MSGVAVPVRRPALHHNRVIFVDLEAGQLEVVDEPLGQLLTGIVGDALLQQPPE